MATHQTAVVFFNGPSVTQFYHTKFPPSWITVGCNYISRHRRVDHVCAFDRQVKDTVEIYSDCQYWTRSGFGDDLWQNPHTDTAHYDSGLLAINVARYVGCHRIYVLGFDWELTNHSVYDELYHWRPGFPNKSTGPKWKSLRDMARKTEMWIVHHTTTWHRDIKPAQWLAPQEFVERCHDEHD